MLVPNRAPMAPKMVPRIPLAAGIRMIRPGRASSVWLMEPRVAPATKAAPVLTSRATLDVEPVRSSDARRTGVRLDGVHKRFGEVVAVAGVDLEVEGGEFFSLLGPSGSGKTTCLRIIAGFEAPTGGRVFLAGRDV